MNSPRRIDVLDILRSQVIILEENVLLLNKTQSEFFYAFNAAFRVDVNDVKHFQEIARRLSADHFHDLQPMPRIFKNKTTNFAFLTMFQQFTTGLLLVMRIPA